MGFFGAGHRWGGGGGGGGAKRPPKICPKNPAVMKLGTIIPTRTKKYMNHVTPPLSFADISIFHWKSANFAISRNTDIDCIFIHNF